MEFAGKQRYSRKAAEIHRNITEVVRNEFIRIQWNTKEFSVIQRNSVEYKGIQFQWNTREFNGICRKWLELIWIQLSWKEFNRIFFCEIKIFHNNQDSMDFFHALRDFREKIHSLNSNSNLQSKQRALSLSPQIYWCTMASPISALNGTKREINGLTTRRHATSTS